MTDAAAINILSLSAAAQDQLLRQYFSAEGATIKLKTALWCVRKSQTHTFLLRLLLSVLISSISV